MIVGTSLTTGGAGVYIGAARDGAGSLSTTGILVTTDLTITFESTTPRRLAFFRIFLSVTTTAIPFFPILTEAITLELVTAPTLNLSFNVIVLPA